MKCTNPVTVEIHKEIDGNWSNGRYRLVPCGKCPACKQVRLNQWVFRLQQEYKSHPFAAFVTLTYDNEHIPCLTDSGEFYVLPELVERKVTDDFELCLQKSHLQKFFRSIRKSGYSIKYYAIGEYSPKKRPHYHVILMSDDLDFTKVDVSDWWPHGFVKLGTVTEASIKYVCKHHLSPKNDGFFVMTSLPSEAMDLDCLFSHPMSKVSLSDTVRRFFARQTDNILRCRGITRIK